MTNTISISAGELKPALAGLAKIIDPRSPIEALRCVRVEAGRSRIQLSGTDSETFAKVAIGEESMGIEHPFHIPFGKLQELARRMPAHTLLHLREGMIQCDLGTGRIEETFDPIDPKTFPEEPVIEESAVELPGAFPARFREALACASKDSTRPILNGVLLDAGDSMGHYLVATDGRHLFSANSFTLPMSRSVVIPSLRIFSWGGLGDDWAIALEEKGSWFRLRSGKWTITSKVLEGGYPNWRQVIPVPSQTVLVLPENHSLPEVLKRFPASSDRDKGILLVHERGVVSLRDPEGNSSASLPGATATGPDITICVNRD